MNPISGKKTPILVKKEFEEIEPKLSPFVKKSKILGSISVPLLLFSLGSIYFLLLTEAVNRNTIVMVVLLSFAGAVGMALLKEAMYQLKAIRDKSLEYIKGRIVKSEVLPEGAKVRYLEQLGSEETDMYHVFHEFLKHERRMNNMTAS
ncbi:DUF5392 family protein [Alteribacillus iranensis]|uniref:Uncharacterized protein n=1 Tax=Alteribacillus iranensis TaxID=930128 RepID=A0A1I2DSE8_9BACI|nr:DUF5392 family protein [Alteribacillus iranensis]SFE83358.1 hypothetical protein SAMN05192532_104270 [Alteribacillus iranensis]